MNSTDSQLYAIISKPLHKIHLLMKTIQNYLLLFCALLSSFTVLAQNVPVIVWEKNYGGTGEDIAHRIIQTLDGGYIVVGPSASNDIDLSDNSTYNSTDMWVVKTNSTGVLEWDEIYGGDGEDIARAVWQTFDGGYIVTGNSNSSSGTGDVDGNYGGSDIWVVKIDANGNTQWDENYGGVNAEIPNFIYQTLDDGYLIGGETNSGTLDNDITLSKGSQDIWLLKILFDGTKDWDKNYGGSGLEDFEKMIPTSDGGYIIAGFTTSSDGDLSDNGNNGGEDIWVVKIGADGDIEWDKNYGGAGDDNGFFIKETSDGGYIIVGSTTSSDGDVGENYGGSDVWVIKVSSNGFIEWEKNYGGTGTDIGYFIEETPDGGYFVTGHSESNDNDVSGNFGSRDIWVFKTDLVGNIEWEKNYGGSGYDFNYTTIPTLDGGYIVGGHSTSSDTDLDSNYGDDDSWIFKIYPPLGGTYTIGPSLSSDFIDLQHAMDSLAQVGMYKQVTLEVEAGITLDGQVIITDFVGLTATDSLTINGNGATLTNSAANCLNPAIIQIDGADHVVIDGLNIVASPTASAAWGIHLKNQADSIYIRNCTIGVGVNQTSTCYMGIVASNSDNSISSPDYYGNNANRTVVHNNTIKGGYMGIAALGNNDQSMKGTVIQNNTIEDSYQVGILTSDLTNFLIKENLIDLEVERNNPNSNNTGIQCRNAISQLEDFDYSVYSNIQLEEHSYSISGIEGNKVYSIGGEGIFIKDSGQNPTDSSNDPPYMVNNMISGNLEGSLPNAGILLENADSWEIYHNSVNVEGNGDGIYIDIASSDIDLQNNTLATNGLGFPVNIESGTSLTWNYNNYFSQNLEIVSIGGSTFDDIPSLPENDNSVSVNPIFITFNDLHVLDISQQTNSANPSIAALFPTDIDGEPRPDGTTQLPDMGADEILPLVILEETLCFTVGDEIHLGISDTLNNPQWIEWDNTSNYSLISHSANLDILATSNTPTYIGVGSGTNATYALIYTIISSDAIASNDSPVCEGEDIQLMGNTTVAGEITSYEWSGPNGFASTEQNPLVLVVDIEDAGDYILKVTADGCESKGDTTVVTVNPVPIATAENDSPTCTGEDVLLSSYTSIAGVTMTYSWSGPNGFSSIFQNPVVSNVDASSSGDYGVTITVDGCESQGIATFVTVSEPPTATLETNTKICNASGDNTIIDLTSLITSGNTSGVWTDTDGIGVDMSDWTAVDFDGIGVGTYTFTYTLSDGICNDVSFEVEVLVEDCACPSVAITEPDDLCNDSGMLDLSVLELTVEPGIWSITNTPLGSNPATLTGTNFDATNVDAGDYELTFTLDSAPLENCPDSSIQILIVQETVNAGIGSSSSTCNDVNTPYDLYSLVSSADVGGTWILYSGSINNGVFDDVIGTFTADGQSAGILEFAYVMTAVAPCENDTAFVAIEVVAPTSATLETNTNICNSSADNTIINLMSLITSGDTSGFWTDTDAIGVDMSDLTAVDFDGIGLGTYTFTYTLSDGICNDISYEVEVLVEECGCPFVVQVNGSANVCSGELTNEITDWQSNVESDETNSTASGNPLMINGFVYSIEPLLNASATPVAIPSDIDLNENVCNSTQTSIFAYLQCDIDGDDAVDDFLSVGVFDLDVYPSPQAPSIVIDSENEFGCSYTLDFSCEGDTEGFSTNINSLNIDVGQLGGTTFVEVVTTNGCSTTFESIVPDCCSSEICCFSGTYIIGSSVSADFSSLQEAINSLTLAGMCGNVVLELETNITLTERVYIPSIDGLSAESNLTINGNGATLTFSPTNSSPAIIQIDEADHIAIDNIDIVAASTSECAWGIHLKNQADSISIRNCTIDMGASVNDTCFIGIVASNSDTSIEPAQHWGNNANHTVIVGNEIIGGFMGIAILGDENKTMKGPVIQNNELKNNYEAGLIVSYLTNFLIKNNEIGNNNGNTGIQCRNTISQLEDFDYSIGTISQLEDFDYSIAGIEGNNLYGMRKQGIYIQNSGQFSDSPPQIVNNTVSCIFSNVGTQNAGVLLENANDWGIFHNSVNTLGNGYALYVDEESIDINLQNNTLAYGSEATTGYAVHIENENSMSIWDYNNYYSNNPNVMVHVGGTDYNAVADLPDNENSVSDNPIFMAFNDLHVNGVSAQTNTGNPTVGRLIPRDIDGELRIGPYPDMGADEIVDNVIDSMFCAFIGDTIVLSIPDSLVFPIWIEAPDYDGAISEEHEFSIKVSNTSTTYIGLGFGGNGSTHVFMYTITGSDALANNNGPACIGMDVTLLGSTSVVKDTILYQWNGPNGFSSTEKNPVLSNVMESEMGEYSLLVTADGCESKLGTTIVEVNVPPIAILNTSATVCNTPFGNSSLNFNNFIILGDTSGYWTDLDNSEVNLNNFAEIDFVGISPNVYRFEYTTNNAIPPCTDESYIIEILVEPCNCVTTAPVIVIDFINSCEGEINSSPFEVNTTINSTIVNWYNTSTGDNLISSGLTFTPIDEGLYYAQTVNIALDTCKSELIPFELKENSTPIASFDISNVTCKNEPILFTFDGIADTDATYTWNFGEGNIVEGIGPHSHAWTSTGEQNITLTIEQNGCSDEYVSEITISEVEVGIISSETIVNAGETLPLSATGFSVMGEVVYTWSSTGNLPDCLDCPETSVTLNQNSNISVVASDEYGCSDSATLSLGVLYKNEVLVPAAFSPNGDGVNDLFGITPVNVSELHTFEIYGRLGNKVFSTNNISDTWDGTYKFVPQGIGIYIYFIRGVDNDGKEFLVKGNVMLIR